LLGLADSTVALLVAILSAAVAILSLGWQAASEARRQRREHTFLESQRDVERRDAAERLMRQYRDPLIYAADQLVNRIHNILELRLFEKHFDADPEYVVNSTVYSVGEMFAWMELVRQDQQFLDVGDVRTTRELNLNLARLGSAFASDRLRSPSGSPAPMMVWRQYQRAIGQLMLDRSQDPVRCIGYVRFNELLKDASFSPWFAGLLRDVEYLATDVGPARPRLQEVASAARELIAHLDPDGVRAPPI
jgi:hypothetical protein